MSWHRKIVFLDIDGVMAGEEYLSRRLNSYIDPEKCKLLNKLKDIGAEIVISSSWGEDADKPLKEAGLELPIIGHTKHFHEDWLCRGNEIERWLLDTFDGMGAKYGKDYNGVPYYRKNRNCDYEFVIIDDDTDMLLGQYDNFVHVDNTPGLTESDIEKVIKILNRE